MGVVNSPNLRNLKKARDMAAHSIRRSCVPRAGSCLKAPINFLKTSIVMGLQCLSWILDWCRSMPRNANCKLGFSVTGL